MRRRSSPAKRPAKATSNPASYIAPTARTKPPFPSSGRLDTTTGDSPSGQSSDAKGPDSLRGPSSTTTPKPSSGSLAGAISESAGSSSPPDSANRSPSSRPNLPVATAAAAAPAAEPDTTSGRTPTPDQSAVSPLPSA